MSELENTKAVLDYLREKSNETTGKVILDWINFEIAKKEKQYNNLSIINADDKDIISQALIEMANRYNANNQSQVSNKIDEVRNRFLETEKYVETNLNLYIKVKLNDYGKKIHFDYWKDICSDTHIPYKLEVDEEGYSTFQIYDFMNVFGEHAHLGSRPFLKTCDMLVERSE